MNHRLARNRGKCSPARSKSRLLYVTTASAPPATASSMTWLSASSGRFGRSGNLTGSIHISVGFRPLPDSTPGIAPSMRCAGASAWVTPCSHTRQAYFGRTVTMTRSWAGMMSSRSVRSSPMRTISPQPQGQFVLSGSMTCSTLSRCSGRWPRLRRASGRFARGTDAGFAGASGASSSASAPSSASKASWSWSGWSPSPPRSSKPPQRRGNLRDSRSVDSAIEAHRHLTRLAHNRPHRIRPRRAVHLERGERRLRLRLDSHVT